MSYFSKIKRHLRLSRKANTKLARIHECWSYVHNILISNDGHSHVRHTKISENLRMIVELLVCEEAEQEENNSNGVCMEYFLKQNILQVLVHRQGCLQGVRVEIVRMITLMIDSLNDRFLTHNAVHIPTVRLLHQSHLPHDNDFVYLIYIIITKIHGLPDLLHIFFYDKKCQRLSKKKGTAATSHIAFKCEFLLFTYMLRFVHCNSKSGEFARKSVLLVLAMATSHRQLKDFILRSECIMTITTALTSLYSQLPTKLAVIHDLQQLQKQPPASTTALFLLLQQDEIVEPPPPDTDYSSSTQFKTKLSQFLTVLEFCQDLCEHYSFLRSQLLLFLRIVFLENVVFQSLMECSDIDGSAVAVLSYINVLLQTIRQKDLVDIIVGFLMDKASGDEIKQCTSAPIEEQQCCTLPDLIFRMLRSSSQRTVLVSLKLLNTLITQHCEHTHQYLITCTNNNNNNTICGSRSIEDISNLYFGLIFAIDRAQIQETFHLGYEEYLDDIEQAILMNNNNDGNKWSIRSNDTLLGLLFHLLSHFLSNSPEINLLLTSVVSALAMCPFYSLEGWVLKSQDDTSLYTVLKTLVSQVDYYRRSVTGFDTFLDERWNVLQFGELDCPTLSTTTSSSTSLSYYDHSMFLCTGSKSTSTVTTAKITATGSSFAASSTTITENESWSLWMHAQKTLSIRIDGPPHCLQKKLTLSTVLNNVILLEEAIKEIVAVIQVRSRLDK